ncbi:MAG: PH domain-containing protein [Acidimicrobiales bacterium]
MSWLRAVLSHYVVWDPTTLLVPANPASGREAEVLKYAERRHVMALLVDAWPAMAVALGGPLLLVRLNHGLGELLLGLVIVIAQIKVLVALLEWSIGRIMVTNRRVIEFGGFLRRTGGSMPLGKMTDLAYDQSFLGLLLDYGMVRVESAGQNQALANIRYLRYPLRFQQELIALGNSPSAAG